MERGSKGFKERREGRVRGREEKRGRVLFWGEGMEEGQYINEGKGQVTI
jgi:hypothetical protein